MSQDWEQTSRGFDFLTLSRAALIRFLNSTITKSFIATFFCIFSPASVMTMSVKSRKNRPVTSAQSFQDAKLALNSLNTWAQLTRWFKTQPDSHIFVYFLSHFCLLHRGSFKTKTCFIYLTKTGCRERVYKWSRIMFDDFGGKKAENIQLAALVSKCCSQIKKKSITAKSHKWKCFNFNSLFSFPLI